MNETFQMVDNLLLHKKLSPKHKIILQLKNIFENQISIENLENEVQT